MLKTDEDGEPLCPVCGRALVRGSIERAVLAVLPMWLALALVLLFEYVGVTQGAHIGYMLGALGTAISMAMIMLHARQGSAHRFLRTWPRLRWLLSLRATSSSIDAVWALLGVLLTLIVLWLILVIGVVVTSLMTGSRVRLGIEWRRDGASVEGVSSVSQPYRPPAPRTGLGVPRAS